MLYSKNAIAMLSFLISPFLGSILFAVNLRDIGRGALGPLFIIGSLVLARLVSLMLQGSNPYFFFAVYNVIGSSLIYFYFFDKLFGDYDYKPKSFWPPTLFFIGVIITLLLVIYFKNGFANF